MSKVRQHDLLYNPKQASLILRCGLAFTFMYAAIDSLREPAAWLPYVPELMAKIIPSNIILDMLAGLQLVLAGWLIWGIYLKKAAIVTVVMLIGIVVFNQDSFLITFRDVGLVAATMALLFLDENNRF